MSAASYDIKIDQGSDFFMTLTFKDANGDRLDLTSFVFDGQIRAQFSNPVILAQFDFTLLDQSVALTKGQVLVSLSGEDSTALMVPALPLSPNSTSRPITKFIYDIETDVGGITKRWLQGAVLLSPEVTR